MSGLQRGDWHLPIRAAFYEFDYGTEKEQAQIECLTVFACCIFGDLSSLSKWDSGRATEDTRGLENIDTGICFFPQY